MRHHNYKQQERNFELQSEEEMENLIFKGASGKIVVMGTTAFDLRVDDKISMTGRELVKKIIEPKVV